jgi:hypothetical protein
MRMPAPDLLRRCSSMATQPSQALPQLLLPPSNKNRLPALALPVPALQVKHVVIPSWYQRPGYVRAMADLISAELTSGAFPDQAAVEIFFSAHGVPVSYIEEGACVPGRGMAKDCGGRGWQGCVLGQCWLRCRPLAAVSALPTHKHTPLLPLSLTLSMLPLPASPCPPACAQVTRTRRRWSTASTWSWRSCGGAGCPTRTPWPTSPGWGPWNGSSPTQTTASGGGAWLLAVIWVRVLWSCRAGQGNWG